MATGVEEILEFPELLRLIELVLTLYGRTPIDSLKLDGDRHHFDLLQAWEPEEQGVRAHKGPGRNGRWPRPSG
ncbi:hypothetical protein ABZ845_31345 [Streptomyces sp. NPDC047022]|uniref:hypothetical protein n=1 Tax=Streptomyces sp. NPDC047022 TaxID=3155737 RepID=UPI0033C62D50